jgi:hypothetical protein
VTHAEFWDDPTIVQVMHLMSRKSGEPEVFVLGTAANNQWDAVTIERPRMSAHAVNVAICIQGIAVEARSAQDWVDAGLLSQDVVDAAPRVHF